MRLRIFPGLALVGAMLVPDAAHAQAVPAVPAVPNPPTTPAAVATLATTDRVRVSWTGSGYRSVRHEGVVVEAGPDAILLETSEGMQAIPAEAVSGVEYGHQRSGWEGFKRGFTVGRTLGGITGIVVGGVSGASCQGDFLCPGPAGGAAILGVMFGLGGGVVGALLKSAAPGVEWRGAPVRTTAGPVPGGGAAVGLRVSF